MPTTRKITIGGHEFEATLPYEAGHTINEAEAKTLNQTRTENLRNNFAKQVKDAGEDPEKIAALADAFAKLDSEYVFTVAGVGAKARRSPEETVARSIAREAIKESLAQQGRKVTTVPAGSTKEEWDAKVEAEIERIASSEQVMKLAKKQVADKKRATEAIMEQLGLEAA